MSVHVCPVCNGTGLKPSTFYPDIPQDTTAKAPDYVPCRACGGLGIFRDPIYPPIKSGEPIYPFLPPWSTAWRGYEMTRPRPI